MLTLINKCRIVFDISDGNSGQEVAGALVLALASATPEICINAASSFGSNDDRKTGLSAIMGSGLIAFSLIPAGCLMAGTKIELSRSASLRDVGFYIFCLVSCKGS